MIQSVLAPILVTILLLTFMTLWMEKLTREKRLAAAQAAAAQAASQQTPAGSMIKTPALQPVTLRPAVDMNLWMPAILALFGSLIVVVLTSWTNTKALAGQIDALRAEVKQGFAELRLDSIQRWTAWTGASRGSKTSA
jgi:hypothetical protein